MFILVNKLFCGISGEQFPYRFSGVGVDPVSRLIGSHLCLEPAPAKAEVSQDVEQLVAPAFIREMELKVAEITFRSDIESVIPERGSDFVQVVLLHRLLNHNDRVVDVPSLDKPMAEEELDLMKENESAAYADLPGIIDGFVPLGRLDSEDP